MALSLALILLVVSGFVGVVSSAPPDRQKGHNSQLDGRVLGDALDMIRRGRTTFRDDTFGSEDFWGGELRLHEAIAKVPPTTALGVGLKVDLDALPRSLVSDLKHRRVDLGDPAVTQALLRLNAVVGVKGFFDSSSKLNSIGIQCALCHSTVDDALAPGIGRRLDGWANRDLNIGAIVALAPDLSPFADLLGVSEDTVRRVLNAWGPGKFDAALSLDGKGFRPDGKTAATLIPPAFGLAGINLHTFTGWGSVTHWNAFVAVLEMHGKGTFYDPRLKDATRFPVAAAAGFDNVRNEEDRVTSKLPALHFYQLALRAPRAPSKLFDRAAAQRGQGLFTGKGKCSTCHVPPLYSEPGYNLHTPAEINIDPFQANRSPDGGYRTTPLKGLWTHMKGGFYHDGRFATLQDVIAHYDSFFGLGLGAGEKADLEEFLKSL